MITKAGRVISQVNLAKLQDAKSHVDFVKGVHYLTPEHGGRLSTASDNLDQVIKTTVTEQPPSEQETTAGKLGIGPRIISVGKAMAHFLAYASAGERETMVKSIEAIDQINSGDLLAEELGIKVKDPEPFGGAPKPWSRDDGNLHDVTHKGNKLCGGKEVQAYCTKIGLKCKSYGEDSAEVEGASKAVAMRFVRSKSWGHKYFDEDSDKGSRVDAFHASQGGLKATSVFGVGKKGMSCCKVFISKPSGKEEVGGEKAFGKVLCPDCDEEVKPDEDGCCPQCGLDLNDEMEGEKAAGNEDMSACVDACEDCVEACQDCRTEEACQECIECCQECIACCKKCGTAECKNCIAACEACIAACKKGPGPECDKCCKACVDACKSCIESC